MSSTNTSPRRTRDRVAIAVVIGILTFALVNMTTDTNQGLGAGVVMTIITWLLTEPRKQKSEK
jgi:hypothetical protein